MEPKEKEVLTYVSNNPGCKSGEIVTQLHINKSSAKRILNSLLEKGLILKQGRGAGTNYTIK